MVTKMQHWLGGLLASNGAIWLCVFTHTSHIFAASVVIVRNASNVTLGSLGLLF